MSGICAIVRRDGAPVDPAALDAMASAAPYREPQGRRIWHEGPAGLLFQALTTSQGVAADRGPLRRDEVTVCADARIDNVAELRRVLSAELGGAPPTPAALILAGYRRWGSDLAGHLLGDFAFVLWDSAQRTLFAARDPMGLRSLSYLVDGGRVLIATEVKQILAAPGVDASLSEAAVAAHLLGEAMPAAWTFYTGISRLAPGHILEVGQGTATTRPFWLPDPARRIRFATEDEYTQAFREIFRDAVRCRMRSDSGVGVFLSGGVDSGAVAATGGQLLAEEPGLAPELRAYSFAFDELTECDERSVSRGIVDHYGLASTNVPADDAWPLRNERDSSPDRDAPTTLWYRVLWERGLALAASRGTVVVLGGDRGDLIGGESIYDHAGLFWRGRWTTLGREWAMLARWQNEPVSRVARRSILRPLSWALWPHSRARRWLRGVRGRADSYRGLAAPWVRRDFLRAHGAGEVHDPRADGLSSHAAAQRFEAIFTPSQMSGFEESERLYASHGTSFADPFSDRRITEFVLAIPQRVVNRPDDRKRLIKQAMVGIVPDTTARAQRKVSPGALGARGLREKEVDTIRRLFEDSEAQKRGWIDAGACLRSYEAYVNGADLPADFWATLSLESWLQHHFR